MWAPHAAVFAGALWATWNGVAFTLDSGVRHRAESAWFIFAAILLVVGVSALRHAGRQAPLDQAPHDGAPDRRAPLYAEPSPFGVLAVCIAIALALYARVLVIGLLSDDFVLLDRAQRGVFADAGWDYVRPVPLAVWWSLDRMLPASLVPMALHTLNVVLHGVNGWLIYTLARRLSPGSIRAWLAALLFLAGPFNVEAVAWASGVFDVLLTTLVLASALNILSDETPRLRAIALGVALAAAAAGTKETAVALPLLLAVVVPFVPPSSRRTAILTAGCCALVIGAYVSWRLLAGLPASPGATLSGYALKEFLSRPFGLLGLGLHVDVTQSAPFLPSLFAVVWPAVMARSAVTWHRDPSPFRLLLMACAWVLVSVLPLVTMLFIGPDLQGSRYLYLGSTMWSIAIVACMCPGRADVISRRGIGVAIPVIAVSAIVVLAHQRPWLEAAEQRDRVLSAFAHASLDCAPARATGLPDHLRGAYIFRNGFVEAVAGTADGRHATAEACGLHWDGATFRLIR